MTENKENEDYQAVAYPERCEFIARKYKKKLIRIEQKRDLAGGYYYVCYFEPKSDQLT